MRRGQKSSRSSTAHLPPSPRHQPPSRLSTRLLLSSPRPIGIYRHHRADDEHVFGDKRDVAGQPVVIAMPKGSPTGLTFLFLTAANISLAKYLSIRDALLKIDQIVVGFYINALNPPLNNHRVKAEKVREIWTELKGRYRMNRYSIVGHSTGGKIALLVAAAYDDDTSVRTIVALNPAIKHHPNSLMRTQAGTYHCVTPEPTLR